MAAVAAGSLVHSLPSFSPVSKFFSDPGFDHFTANSPPRGGGMGMMGMMMMMIPEKRRKNEKERT